MSIRTAMMEMYGAKKVKREAWVPEGIADEDVSDFMGAAAAAKKAGKDSFKFGDKTYKVTMKSTTARQIDAAKEIEEQSCECGENAECECAEPVEEALDAKDTDTVKAVVKALKGASKAHAGQAKQLKKDLQDAADTEMDPKDHVKYNDEMEMYCVYNKDGKVVAKFKDEEDANNYAMKNHDDLMEAKAPGATAQHSATKETSDTFEKQMSAGEGDIPMGKKKDFVKQHEMEVGLDAEKIYQQNKYEALSKTPARPGDKPDGDKTPVNPVKVDMVDGMRKALAQMKLSGD